MAILGEDGSHLTDESGAYLLDESRSPTWEIIDVAIRSLTITDTPATTVRSAWSASRRGPTTVSIYGDWGSATKLDFVYSPVYDGTSDDTIAPPAGATNQEYPIFKSVASTDTEMVFQVEPSAENYKLAVIPTGNDGTTDLQVWFS